MLKFIDSIKNIEQPIIKIMLKGFKFSYVICVLALFILIIHIIYPFSKIVYESGLILFRTGLMFAIQFVICAFVIDKIKKQM